MEHTEFLLKGIQTTYAGATEQNTLALQRYGASAETRNNKQNDSIMNDSSNFGEIVTNIVATALANRSTQPPVLNNLP
jgi:hypothetical protein